VALFRVSPAPGATPGDLFGGANKPVSGAVTLSCAVPVFIRQARA
jgi:hypothetical protein